jgi:hypothetical protein
MMMILHQMRHGRQDNHVTNHVRCTKTRKAGQSRRHIEAKQSKTALLKLPRTSHLLAFAPTVTLLVWFPKIFVVNHQCPENCEKVSPHCHRLFWILLVYMFSYACRNAPFYRSLDTDVVLFRTTR